MKSRFSTIDIKAIVQELQRFLGLRVVNVYDIDNKTYMVKLAKPDEKGMVLIESGSRLHSTEFDWPKNPAPSGFSMKLRKHLRGRRVERIDQLGIDRIVDLQFGSGEAAYHLIVELYDRGNLVLTDFEYTILNILRPRTDDGQDVKFAVRETYPMHTAKEFEPLTEEGLRQVMLSAKEGDPLKKVLMPNLDFGPALLEHCLREAGFSEGVKMGKGFAMDTDFHKLFSALVQGETIMNNLSLQSNKGYIIQKCEKRPNAKDGEDTQLLTYDEFHPYLFKQHKEKNYKEFDRFDQAVDEYFSQLESQKLDMKALQQEKSALKKLENVKKDHEKRLTELQKEQEVDFRKGQLVEMNLELVDRAILIVRSALANQIDWTEINNLVKEAQGQGDPVAGAIKSLKLDTNHIIMLLSLPYVDADEEDDGIKPMKVDIDLSLSAYANSRKYFEKKKQAAKKEQKTVDASTKAFKSAEKKTKQTLKDVATAVSINKTRKTYWFEKFLWFISSENFLVIGGRDQQQNELIVKRYLRPGDVYVHADLHGASSVIVKNSTGEPVPPKTLNEAGTMAICNSAAWDAKVVTSAWWVHPEQVSKTAPTGEYLTTGSFMIRGKKNYLPPSYLVYGFGFLFKLEDGSIFRHRGERKVRTIDDEESSVADSMATESEVTVDTNSGDDESGSDEEREEIQDTMPNEDGCENHAPNMSGSDDEEENEEADANSPVATNDAKESDQGGQPTNENGEEESQSAFPDTSICLQHEGGGKFSLQTQSSVPEDHILYLGDDQPIIVGEYADTNTQSSKQGVKLSAKQRRELKKAKKSQTQSGTDNGIDEEDKTSSSLHVDRTKETNPNLESHSSTAEQQQAKRGQKSKQKKIKEKYKDQDEEERQLRMEILASAGSQKEDKKKRKKAKEAIEKGVKLNSQQQQKAKQHLEQKQQILLSIQKQKEEDSKALAEDVLSSHTIKKEEEDSGSEEEKDEKPQADDSQVLDSLTGLPVLEDEILYGLPVCAPYQALGNYKYKVKLLPGTTKKGKATKTAINMFMYEKEATSREKDLLRVLKDADVSRNMPGKVKVTAPNLHKHKKK